VIRPVIEFAGLTKRFQVTGPGRWRAGRRTLTAVEQVDFTALDGHITALLGPNGAGKTTTLRMAAGLIEPDAGHVVVDGFDVQHAPAEAAARLGLLGDARGLYPRLTARENIVYYGALHGMAAEQAAARAETLAAQFDLRTLLDRRCEGFSQGERMKTALARALVHDPPNIILDEPTNGLDVLATRALREALRSLCSAAGGRKCIVFSTHLMQEVLRLCDHVVVMARGRSVAIGSVDELLALTGETDFEAAFVQLAYGRTEGRPAAGASESRGADTGPAPGRA
jgi:sodium transport system ATP-binding protein